MGILRQILAAIGLRACGPCQAGSHGQCFYYGCSCCGNQS